MVLFSIKEVDLYLSQSRLPPVLFPDLKVPVPSPTGRVRKGGGKKTYNTGDSLVVTEPTTDPAVTGLSMGEQTGSRVFQYLWSYVLCLSVILAYN